MPVYLLHGFRWPRPLIRIHIILQNLDDAAAEWLVAPSTTKALLWNFSQLYPDCMEHVPHLRFCEQYDPTDESSHAVSQPYAYVADVVEEVKLGLDIDEVRQRGVGNEQWAAMMELRDKLAPEEKVGWYVVVCGDEERWAPPTLGDSDAAVQLNGNSVGTPAGSSEGASVSAGSTEQQPRKEASPQNVPATNTEPRGLKKIFGSLTKRKSRASVRESPIRSDSFNSTESPQREVKPSALAVQPQVEPLPSLPHPVPYQQPLAMDGHPSLTNNSDSDSNLDLPSIAEAPDTSQDAIKTLNTQASTATLESVPRRPKSSGRDPARASWSTINYGAFYNSSNYRGSLPNLHTSQQTPTTSRQQRNTLNLDTSIDPSAYNSTSFLNGHNSSLSPAAMTPATLGPGDQQLVSPMASFDRSSRVSTMSTIGKTPRSVSPVSELSFRSSYGGGYTDGSGGTNPKGGRRKSRAQSTLSTISDQTICPDDLVAKNMDFVGTKLGV